MTTKRGILASAAESLTEEDKDLAWAIGEWKIQYSKQNKKKKQDVNFILWEEVIGFVTFANQARITKYMNLPRFRDNWMSHLVPHLSKRHSFTELVHKAEDFCERILQARKRKRSVERYANLTPFAHKLLFPHAVDKKTAAQVPSCHPEEQQKNRVEPPTKRVKLTVCLEGYELSKHEGSIDESYRFRAQVKRTSGESAPVSPPGKRQLNFQSMESPRQQPLEKSSSSCTEKTEMKRVTLKTFGAECPLEYHENSMLKNPNKSSLQNLQWDASIYKHLCPNSCLGLEEMELAFLLQRAKALKEVSPWNHVYTSMSNGLARFIRARSHVPSFKKRRMEALIGRLDTKRRKDFETFRDRLRIEDIPLMKGEEEEASKRHSPVNNTASQPSRQAAMAHGSMTSKFPQWDASKYKSLESENLGAVEMELAFLLEQAKSLKVISPWKHVHSLMSNTLADFISSKSHKTSFEKRRIILLIGDLYTPRRDEFESFRLTLRHGELADGGTKKKPKSQPTNTKQPSAITIVIPTSKDAAENQKKSVPVNLLLQKSPATTLAQHLPSSQKIAVPNSYGPWDASQYNHCCPEGLRPEEMELAFLLEQGRCAQPSSPWQHVETRMSSTLADFIRTKSHLHSYEKGRVRALIGRCGEAHRQDFELFRSNLRKSWGSNMTFKKGPVVQNCEGKTITLAIVMQGVVIAKHEGLLEKSFSLSSKIEVLNQPEHSEHLRLTATESALPTWEASEYGKLASELLTPDQRELAFLLAEGDIMAPENPWEHAKSNMSKSLDRYVKSKEHLVSFRNNRLRVLIGERSGPKRRAFEFCRSKFAKIVVRRNKEAEDGVPLSKTDMKDVKINGKTSHQDTKCESFKPGYLKKKGGYPRQRILLSLSALLAISLCCSIFYLASFARTHEGVSLSIDNNAFNDSG